MNLDSSTNSSSKNKSRITKWKMTLLHQRLSSSESKPLATSKMKKNDGDEPIELGLEDAF